MAKQIKSKVNGKVFYTVWGATCEIHDCSPKFLFCTNHVLSFFYHVNSVNSTGSHCPFSNMIPADNPCTRAHSAEELEEWNERHQYRRMKVMKAKQHNIYSFLNQLQAEYGAADFEMDVVSSQSPC